MPEEKGYAKNCVRKLPEKEIYKLLQLPTAFSTITKLRQLLIFVSIHSFCIFKIEKIVSIRFYKTAKVTLTRDQKCSSFIFPIHVPAMLKK
jgi:hypothetical protein